MRYVVYNQMSKYLVLAFVEILHIVIFWSCRVDLRINQATSGCLQSSIFSMEIIYPEYCCLVEHGVILACPFYMYIQLRPFLMYVIKSFQWVGIVLKASSLSCSTCQSLESFWGICANLISRDNFVCTCIFYWIT